ncbi:MAG: PD-(D/E)XK nuclease family protein [Brevibacterium aurantiacum]|uniref:PD-(D/E)XK nuclease family protein n=1 Tax=Brevibacterium aurantiacum TaxID=273384 RepID=UPI003F924C66
MRIVFGWNLDRAPWSTDTTGTTVVTGPLGLLGILQTRLGTTRPSVDRPIRIAQYRSLLARADHPWYRRSFANDPWNTAHHLLELRDDAIEAGWNPTDDGRDYSAQPRLDALATAEKLVVLGPPHDQTASLAPGRADDLREVLDLLRLHGADWPLGITSIELRDKRDDLPQVWQDILKESESAGVTVTVSRANSATPNLTIVRGPDEWSTAEAAARFISHLPNRDRHCIIAGDSTAVLDQQLARRLTPTLGIPGASTTTPSAQVLPVFLSAVLPPTDVRPVAELLHLSFGSTDSESSAKTLVPLSVSTVLLKALAREPGISGDPKSAWMTALRALEDHALRHPDTASRAWDTARTLDEFLRVNPPQIHDDEITLKTLAPALDWLSTRLHRLKSGHRANGEPTRTNETQPDTDAFIAEAATHLDTFRAALGMIGPATLRTRELFDIAESCAPASPREADTAQAADWTVVTEPCNVPDGRDTIVWWACHRTGTATAETWDPAEIAALAEAGAHISSTADRERLRQAAELSGLRAAPNLVCFCPDTLRGDQLALHPTLSRLAEDIAVAHPGRFTSTSVDSVLTDPAVTRPVAELIDTGTWHLHDVTVATTTVEPEHSTRPQTVSRTLDGDFTHLLPANLSYSQIDQLLSDPQEWVLSRALGLRRGFTFDIPTGDRMIGTLVHAVVEHLVKANSAETRVGESTTGETDDGATPATSTIRATFDRLVPRFAAELLLPGQLARLNTIRSTALASLTHLFAAAQNRGFDITDAEADFAVDWTLTLAGTPWTVQLRGQRDLQGAFVDGREVIIDLKWTKSDRRYRTMIDDGEAVQLSVYSRTTESPSGAQPLTSYFMLKQGRFVTTDAGLDPNVTAGADAFDDDDDGLGGDPAGLWPIIEESVAHALSNIATGRFDSLNADAHATRGCAPVKRGTQMDKPLKDIKADELSEGRLFVVKNQFFSDFNLIYGIAGDHS